jgi:predicted ABC-type ATPase
MSKRIRIFAGPNGSGKSTLFKYIKDKFPINTGPFVNADDIYNKFEEKHTPIDIFEEFGIKTSNSELNHFVLQHGLKKQVKLTNVFDVKEERFVLVNENNSYIAAIFADFVRNKMIASCTSTFSFETVFSHNSKLDFMKNASDLGFKVYLYFISTNDPIININRVAQRVSNGGHPVQDYR